MSLAVRSIALVALGASWSDTELDALVSAFDVNRMRCQMVGLGLCEPQTPEIQIARLYFSRRCSAISPNVFFDEAWYVDHYQDVRAAIRSHGLLSGFVHYVKRGIIEARWPNPTLSAAASAISSVEPQLTAINGDVYLKLNPSAAAFIEAFPSITPLEHYNIYGRLLGYKTERRKEKRSSNEGQLIIEAAFNRDWYRQTYMQDGLNDDPFEHYIKFGAKAGHSPNPWFDESWYRAFYPEVKLALKDGWLPSGFYHYLYSGRIEGRLPRHDLTLALEARMPGITTPTLLQRTGELGKRLAKSRALPQLDHSMQDAETTWFFFPTLNPDIMFGGYRAAIWFIIAMLRDGRAVKIVCLDEEPSRDYFLLHETSAAVRSAFSSIPMLSGQEFTKSRISHLDRFIAYSVWDLPLCSKLASIAGNKLPILLAQEYEPVFYDNGAPRALCEELYRTPHYAIINSEFLRTYFAARKIGVFEDPFELERKRKHVVFEHKINQLPLQGAAELRAKRTRMLVLYARPEAHASRNLFEVAILALQQLCADSCFGPEWRFEGVGALSRLPPVDLGGGHELRLHQKQSETAYCKMCASMDVGVSLMYAPHPSVVPFEFATTGAIVVTNVYENRSAAQLSGKCANIIPCELSVEDVARAIRAAKDRAEDFERREQQRFVPPTSSWDEIFNPRLIADVFDEVSSVQGSASVVPLKSRQRNSSPRKTQVRRGAA